MSLRPDQERAVNEVLAAFGRHRSALLVSPVGSGKTLMFAEVCRRIQGRALIVAHRRELLRQAANKVLAASLKPSIIAPGHRHDPEAPVWVASIQTLARREMDFSMVQLAVFDEAHRAVSPTALAVIEALPHALILGVTATPQRLDGRGLGQVFEHMVLAASVSELIAAGHLAAFDYYGHRDKPDLAGVPMRQGDYAPEHLAPRMLKSVIMGNAVQHYARLCPGRPAVAFAVNVEHARALAAAFAAQGWRAASVDGSMSHAERDRRISGLATGELHVLVSVELVSEGLDIPGIEACILQRPTASPTLAIQQTGRALRPKPNGARAVILDHVGNYERHGLPDDDRAWSLEGRVGRKATPGGLTVWTCAECYRCNRSTCPACTGCGAAKPRVLVEMEERAAELELIGRAKVEDVHELCRTPEEYVRFARSKGKRTTWAALRWHERKTRTIESNPFIAAAGTVRPTLREFLVAAEECGVHREQARIAGRMMGLRR
jgi:superfamily II DNA or RNA helicase